MKSIKDVDVKGKRVLVRVDYNLPVDEDSNITDDNRVKVTLDLVEYLLKNGARIILASHMGRPGGKRDDKFSLAPVSRRLSRLIGKEVFFADDCIGDSVRERTKALKPGQILLLENLRFHRGEKENDEDFAEKMAELCDIYVNNAFAVSHREHASIAAITRFVPELAAGFLLEKEIKSYYDSVENPRKPLVSVIGGAKVSGKLEALENMLKFVDRMIIGGAMANTFLKSMGIDTKGSMIEEDLLETAAVIVDKARERGIDLFLPADLVVAEKFDKNSPVKEVSTDDIPEHWIALDIGPETRRIYADAIRDAGTIVWNGPMGVFEMENFMQGTRAVAFAIADSNAFSIVGGGDTGLAVKKCGVSDRISYISTGGGAFLCLMEGKKLPGVIALG